MSFLPSAVAISNRSLNPCAFIRDWLRVVVRRVSLIVSETWAWLWVSEGSSFKPASVLEAPVEILEIK